MFLHACIALCGNPVKSFEPEAPSTSPVQGQLLLCTDSSQIHSFAGGECPNHILS